MNRIFSITAASERVSVGGDGRGEITFTVTNSSARRARPASRQATRLDQGGVAEPRRRDRTRHSRRTPRNRSRSKSPLPRALPRASINSGSTPSPSSIRMTISPKARPSILRSRRRKPQRRRSRGGLWRRQPGP